MNNLFKKLISFISYCTALTLLLLAAYMLYFRIGPGDIPAANLSDSYSFNEKMEFLRTHPKSATVLANGSSMTLNNLHSQTITERMHAGKYMNTASWGMSMKDNYLSLRVLAETYHPATLIITSNIIDFQQPDKNVRYSALKNFLRANNLVSAFYHLSEFNLQYYITYFRYAKKVRAYDNGYEYLGFDDHGAVNYDSSHFRIDQTRWENDLIGRKTEEYQYAYLDSISRFCRQRHIKLLFFQSPLRNGIYANLSPEKRSELNRHISRLEAILSRDHQVFVNSNAARWDDRLFVDAMHFNTQGARVFTDYCFDKVENL